MSNEFPRDFLGIPKQVLKILNGCSKEFQIISKGFSNHVLMIVFGFHSDFHGFSKDFQWISLGFLKDSL